jgi:WD40 repeat protein
MVSRWQTPASSSLSGAGTMITMLDAATGKKLTDYKQHHLDWLQPYTILAVQWLPDSRHIITRYALPGNAEFRAWNALTGTTSLEAFTSLDSWEEVLGNGKYLTLGASNGHQATTWNIASGQKLATIDATIVDPGKYTWQGTTFQTQTSLYLASFNGTTITLWNAMTGKPVYSSAFPVGKNAAYMLSWSPDGHYLAAQRSPLSWSANSPNATNTVIQVWKIE